MEAFNQQTRAASACSEPRGCASLKCNKAYPKKPLLAFVSLADLVESETGTISQDLGMTL